MFNNKNDIELTNKKYKHKISEQLDYWLLEQFENFSSKIKQNNAISDKQLINEIYRFVKEFLKTNKNYVTDLHKRYLVCDFMQLLLPKTQSVLSNKEKQKMSDLLYELILCQYQEFESTHRAQYDIEDVKTPTSHYIYRFTKNCLNAYQDYLTPEDKGGLFHAYIQLWTDTKCELYIDDTEYAELYKDSGINRAHSLASRFSPMVAGFNLQSIVFEDVLSTSNFIFLSVNLKGANLSNSILPSSYFENCDLSEINANNTAFNKCSFYKCNLQKAMMQNTGLCETAFRNCDLQNTNLKNARLYQTFFDYKTTILLETHDPKHQFSDGPKFDS